MKELSVPDSKDEQTKTYRDQRFFPRSQSE